MRRTLAAERQVPPYVIFSDATLRELARIRPTTPERMRLVYGVGEAKLRDFAPQFLRVIAEHGEQRGLAMDVQTASSPRKSEPAKAPTMRQHALNTLFRQELAIEDVMHQANLARSTVTDYLASYIRSERPASIRTWVDDETYQHIAQTARQVGSDRLKPIFIALGEKVPYDTIRLVVAHLVAREENAAGDNAGSDRSS